MHVFVLSKDNHNIAKFLKDLLNSQDAADYRLVSCKRKSLYYKDILFYGAYKKKGLKKVDSKLFQGKLLKNSLFSKISCDIWSLPI